MPLYNVPVSFNRTTATTINAVTNSLSTTVATIVPANINRKGLTITNRLSVPIYIDSANTLTTSNYMLMIPAGALYEMPASDCVYTGDLFAILPSGTGSALVRELI